jgi:hypothetical protein
VERSHYSVETFLYSDDKFLAIVIGPLREQRLRGV